MIALVTVGYSADHALTFGSCTATVAASDTVTMTPSAATESFTDLATCIGDLTTPENAVTLTLNL